MKLFDRYLEKIRNKLISQSILRDIEIISQFKTKIMDYELTEVEKECEANVCAERIFNEISLDCAKVMKSDFHDVFIEGLNFAERFYLDKYDWKPIAELKGYHFPIVAKTENEQYSVFEYVFPGDDNITHFKSI